MSITGALVVLGVVALATLAFVAAIVAIVMVRSAAAARRTEAESLARERAVLVSGEARPPGPAGGAGALRVAAEPAPAAGGPARAPSLRAEPAMREAADALAEGIVAIDADGSVVLANDAAHRLLDRRPGSLVGRSAIEAFLDHRIEDLVLTARTRGAASAELPPRLTDGRRLAIRARHATGGDVWVVLEDVTELRRLQRIRAEFVDNLSHELRTPVTNVTLLLEMLARDSEQLPPRSRERVERLQVETEQLAQMVSELLDLAAIESGQPLMLGDVDLAEVARVQVERLGIFAERSGVVLRVDAPEHVAEIRGDETRLGQAILNLVHNAVKFSEPGDAVVVRVADDDGVVTIAVADEGAGIPRADRDRVFERFYKVDRARQRGVGGTGLGLSIVRHVVEAHGGTVAVESEEGVGSTFTISIPITGGPAPNGEAAEPAPQSAVADPAVGEAADPAVRGAGDGR